MRGETISRLEREAHVGSSREDSSTDRDRETLSNAEALSDRRETTLGRSGSGPQAEILSQTIQFMQFIKNRETLLTKGMTMESARGAFESFLEFFEIPRSPLKNV